MFSPDEMEAVAVLDRVAEDMRRGVARFTEVSAEDFPKVVRAGLLWKEVAEGLLRERVEAARSAMGVFDADGREVGL